MNPAVKGLKKPSAYVAVAILLFTAVFAAVGAWKYSHYRYTGIDLAYFAQVFWNTVHGRLFVQSIHPHLSLGDHAELAIPLIAIPYALWQDPRMLILLQALALALPAWPIFLIARRRLAGTALERLGPPAFAAAWLLNPAVQNPALFEFHVLPFALVPLFFALLEYERERKLPFMLWCLAALIVREDVALVVAMVGVLAWIERRKPWWVLAPLLMGAAWFAAAIRLIAVFEPAGGYKFMIYYSWLGPTPLAAARAAIWNPGMIFHHVATLSNLELLVGLTFPLMFFPIFRPRRLWLALGPILQTILSEQGGGALTFQTHYALLYLPGLFLAAIEGSRFLPAWFERHRFPFGARETLAGLLLAGVYGAATLGPLPSSVAAISFPESRIDRLDGDAVTAFIPADRAVAASYRLLPHLASRERLYSLHYQFLGVTQFGEKPYAIPDDVRIVAEDRRDLLTYRAQYSGVSWAAPHLEGGEERLRSIMKGDGVDIWPYRLFGVAAGTPPMTFKTSVPTPPGLPKDAVLHAELSLDGLVRVVELPVEFPETVVSIPTHRNPPSFLKRGQGTSFANDVPGGIPPPATWTFQSHFERQEAIFSIDGLRTPERLVLSRERISFDR